MSGVVENVELVAKDAALRQGRRLRQQPAPAVAAYHRKICATASTASICLRFLCQSLNPLPPERSCFCVDFPARRRYTLTMPARTVDLEAHRDWITSQVRNGRSLDYIRTHMPPDGPGVSYNTLRRRLDAWGLQNQVFGEHGSRRRARRNAGLEEAKAWIVASYQRWDALPTIRDSIRHRLGIEISARRLQSLLHGDWGLPKRSALYDSPAVRDFMTGLAEAGRSVAHIQRHLQHELALRVSDAWVRVRLREWGLSRPRFWNVVPIADADVPGIKEYIELTFFESKQCDADMKEELETMGYHISLRQIVKFRKDMGLLRRHQRLQADDDLERLRQALRSHPRADILVPRLPKKMLPIFFKQEFKIPVSCVMAWRFMQENYPEAMLQRVREVARRRGGFLCRVHHVVERL